MSEGSFNQPASVSLPARQAYALWAPQYEAETAVSFLEDAVVAELGLATAGRRVLDVGCGTGRRLAGVAARSALGAASLAIGVDATPEMLAQRGAPLMVAAADVRTLPFASRSFDVVWCRLVIGHVAELVEAYAELGRVCAPGGTLIVTDFHPDAVAAGHRRTFRDGTGVVREIEHHVHTRDAHAHAAATAGLTLASAREGRVGERIRRFYETRGDVRGASSGTDVYQQQLGLALVLALAWERRA